MSWGEGRGGTEVNFESQTLSYCDGEEKLNSQLLG